MATKIIILEDEKILGKLYKKALEESDFEVRWEQNIADFEMSSINFKPDIALLDQSLNGEAKTGIDEISFLKSMLPNCKICMLSNYSDFHLREKVLKAGADDYLVKIDHPPHILIRYIQDNLLDKMNG